MSKVRYPCRIAAAVTPILLVAVACTGYEASRSPQPPQSQAPGEAPASPAGTVVAFAAVDDGWFRLTDNDGCGSCTVIWRRDGDDGTWRRLAEISGRDAYAGRVSTDFGPVSQLAVTGDGRHGWAWYRTLWSTHDGGATWRRVLDGPGRPTVTGHKVVLTDAYAWALRSGVLWRSPLARDDWVRVEGIDLSGAVDLLALSDQVVVQVYGEGLSNPRLLSSTDGSAWHEFALPCHGETHPRADATTIFVACPHGEGKTVIYSSTGLASWDVAGRVAADASVLLPLSPHRVLLDRRQGGIVLLDAGETQPVAIPRQPRLVYSAASRAGVVYLVTSRGVIRSNDDGATWGPACAASARADLVRPPRLRLLIRSAIGSHSRITGCPGP